MNLRGLILILLFLSSVTGASASSAEKVNGAPSISEMTAPQKQTTGRSKIKRFRDGNLPSQNASDNGVVDIDEQVQNSADDAKIEAIVDAASSVLGCPYVYGAKGPRQFDCSGFTSYVYKQALGMILAANAAGQSQNGLKVEKTHIRPGDLVFFTGSNSGSRTVGHVGVVLEADGTGDFWFIHASSSQGVVVEHLGKSAYFKVRYLGARRMY